MKRHEFEMIADALKYARNRCVGHPAQTGVDIAAEEIADALAKGTAPGGNCAFDRDLFLRNAGVTEI